MLKKIILSLFAASLATMAVAFADVANPAAQLSNEASMITVKSATVEFAKMGPMGQANPAANRISTEAKMNINNRGETAAKIIAVTSNVANKVQLHQFVNKNGKRVMQQISSITINPHTTDDLSFQGVHIMLMGLKKPLVKGENIPITLIFADGSHLQINTTVQSN